MWNHYSDLCGGHDATHTCNQVQNMDYYDEFGHCNLYFDQYGPNWDNSYTYGWDNQYNYSDSSRFYDFQPNCVQQDIKSSWELAIERLANAPLSWELESETLANDSKPS